MCGIFGYMGLEPACPHLLTALKRMEYRGYDSAGLAVHTETEISVCKRQGKVKNLVAACANNPATSFGLTGIAHTRWATHGKPSDVNAHPQFNADCSIAVVHNGIIENYAALKAELINKGYVFRSETDTELLAHLVQDVKAELLKTSPSSSSEVSWGVVVATALHLVTGTYGVVFMFKDSPNLLVAARKGSPLILGVSPTALVLASDAAALVEHTNDVLYLRDGELVELRRRLPSEFTYRVRSLGTLATLGKSVDECIVSPLVKLELSLEQIEKGGFKHFMLKEIIDQPNCLNNTLRGRLYLNAEHQDLSQNTNANSSSLIPKPAPPAGEDAATSVGSPVLTAPAPDAPISRPSSAGCAGGSGYGMKLGGLCTPIASRGGRTALALLCEARRVIITACGTSWHSALIGEYLIEQYCRIPVEVEYASEFRYRDPILFPDSDVVVAISQSGETADTLEAVRLAKSRGVLTLGVVNVVGSSIARETDAGVYLHAGPEIGVASTKAFTSQVLVLLLIALNLASSMQSTGGAGGVGGVGGAGSVGGGGGCQGEVQELLGEVSEIGETIRRTIESTQEQVKKLAQYFRLASNFLFLGRGILFPVALEAALKLKEISYIHAEGYPAAEMKHGPIALIDHLMPVVVIAAKSDPHYDKIKSNIEQVRARQGELIIVTQEGNHDFDEIVSMKEFVIKVPHSHVNLTPLVSIVPLQLLSYYIADLRGCSIDQPRNLAKSVTVE